MKLNKINVSIICVIMGFGMFGCVDKNKTPTTTPADEVLQQFQPLPHVEPEPLEEIAIPPRDEAPSNSGFYRLRLGQVAPVDGFLFSDPAAAFIVTEYQAINERFTLTLRNQIDRDYARLQRDTLTLRLQNNTDRARMRILYSDQQETVNLLNETLEKETSGNYWTNILLISAAGLAGASILLNIILLLSM